MALARCWPLPRLEGTDTTSADAFRALELRCHALLRDVPLHDVWVIELDGGGPGRTVQDVYAASGRSAAPPPLAVRALFALRRALGKVFRLDGPRRDRPAESYLARLTDDDRARSLVAPGAMRGNFRALYVFPDEAVAEVRNATVHAFVAGALRPRAGGYTLYGAVYVKPVGRVTSLYMALIDPFRRLLVYPALIRQTREAWARTYA